MRSRRRTPPSRSGSPPPRRQGLATALVDGDGDRLGHREAIVARPLERDGAALDGDRPEREERIGRDRRVEVGAEDLRPVVRAHEAADDVAWDGRAELASPIAGLHRMGDQRLDLDDFPATGALRNVDQRVRHHASSRQAARVTTTSARSDQNEPSDSSQIATTVCVSASRIRVETLARPARGPRWKLTTSGCGFFSVKTWMART